MILPIKRDSPIVAYDAYEFLFVIANLSSLHPSVYIKYDFVYVTGGNGDIWYDIDDSHSITQSGVIGN